MTLSLTAEQSRLIQEALQSGIIESPEEVLALGLENLRDRLKGRSQDSLAFADDWFLQLKAWADSHPTDTPLLSDDAVSRESIYPDRL